MQQKIQDWASALLAFAIGLLALIGVLLFAWHVESATPWAEMKAADWSVWVGGIGTVATLVGTIRIATSAERTRRREQLDHALIVAAELTLWIADLGRALQSAQSVLPYTLKAPDDPKAACGEAVARIDSVGIWPREQLAALVPLPNHTAARLAWVTTKIRSTLANLRRVSEAEHIKESMLPAFTQIIDRQLSTCAQELDELQDECVAFLGSHRFGSSYVSSKSISPTSGAVVHP